MRRDKGLLLELLQRVARLMEEVVAGWRSSQWPTERAGAIFGCCSQAESGRDSIFESRGLVMRQDSFWDTSQMHLESKVATNGVGSMVGQCSSNWGRPRIRSNRRMFVRMLG